MAPAALVYLRHAPREKPLGVESALLDKTSSLDRTPRPRGRRDRVATAGGQPEGRLGA
ncbi:hypothetical protein [uncultured Thiocystis sp.]|jgi:hypothetical protein|uniref:hypothetical protein n=1 Tax=uncultured Thiocystis sp. TaxID=1202134 RepID=UPI0025DC3797|nr:hypothetical protein [uncultured Thiocystis sp.]